MKIYICRQTLLLVVLFLIILFLYCCYCVQDVLCKSELELLNLLNVNIYTVRTIIEKVCKAMVPSATTVSSCVCNMA